MVVPSSVSPSNTVIIQFALDTPVITGLVLVVKPDDVMMNGAVHVNRLIVWSLN